MPCLSQKLKMAGIGVTMVAGGVTGVLGVAALEAATAGTATIGAIAAIVAGFAAEIAGALAFIAAAQDLRDCLDQAGRTDEATKLEQRIQGLQRDVQRLQEQKSKLESLAH
jgi:hypothetical protein